MGLLPKKNTWRKTILFYRFLRYRKGFGVHSPFAFALITRVINERWGFYCYDDIELIRRQLVHKGSTGVRREIKRSHGQLLFRVVNYFKPKQILQIGSPAGIATLYLTSYASDIQCIALEADAESARETAWCMRKYAHAPLYSNTQTEYFAVGEDWFAKFLEELKKAEHYIFMEYFIIGEGYMWDSILDVLKEKAANGVEVRLIYDDLGCVNTLPPQYYRTLQSYGII